MPDRTSRTVRRSFAVSVHPEISWSIVLEVALREPPDPVGMRWRLEDFWPGDGRVGRVPQVVVAPRSTYERLLGRMANVPYRENGTLSRVLASPEGLRLAVAGHHAAHDGLGLMALASAAIGTPLGTTARGVGTASGAAGPRAGYAMGRLLEAVARPPTRIVPEAGLEAATRQRGDRLTRTRVDGSVSTAGMVAASVRAVAAWNRGRGRPASRVVVAVGASRVPGGSPQIGRHSAWFRLSGAGPDTEAVRRQLRTSVPEPDRASGLMRLAGVTGVARLLERRTGSTLLVSNLGRVVPSQALEDAVFYPAAHGRSGVSIGAVGLEGHTTLTLRARCSDFTQEAAAALLSLVAGELAAGRS